MVERGVLTSAQHSTITRPRAWCTKEERIDRKQAIEATESRSLVKAPEDNRGIAAVESPAPDRSAAAAATVAAAATAAAVAAVAAAGRLNNVRDRIGGLGAGRFNFNKYLQPVTTEEDVGDVGSVVSK